MIVRLLSALAVLGAPGAAWACATCLASPWGDRTFNWAYLGLLLTPLALAAAVAGALGWVAWRRRRPAGPARAGVRHRAGAEPQPANLTVEETS